MLWCGFSLEHLNNEPLVGVLVLDIHPLHFHLRLCFRTSHWGHIMFYFNPFFNFSTTVSISASVVSLPRLKRIAPRASAGSMPMAVSTCEGSTRSPWHSAPGETAKSCPSASITSVAMNPSKRMFQVFGNFFSGWPFRCTFKPAFCNPSNNSCRFNLAD